MSKRKAKSEGTTSNGLRTAPDQDRRDAIVAKLDTTMLVEASAGAGKTRSMVDRMIALVVEGKCRVDTLAAITFTRKAAAELRARFQVSLENAARSATGIARQRLADAVNHVERVFIGTIHSFCGRLLRERPVEAGVEPSFQELDEAVDANLRSGAWSQYVAECIAAGAPILGELLEKGLQIADLEESFTCFATYPDVDEWPAATVELPDLDPARRALRDYMAHIEALVPTLPDDHGRDKLMPKLKRIERLARQADLAHPVELMELLSEFGEPGKATVVQKNWPGKKAQALEELDRWEDFVAHKAAPLVSLWCQSRYPIILRALNGAVTTYNRLREDAGGLNYQDLLLLAARLLRDKSQIRRYFRNRFTHLLVDEFQDTDPVQAEVMLLLTADDPEQTDWRRTKPVSGALFVVGDPKQSIYRFRRADIVTYNEVKKIIEQNGEVITLSANFRSCKAVIEQVNTTFNAIFPGTADAFSPARSPMDCAKDEGVTGGPEGVEVLRIPDAFGNNDLALEYEIDVISRLIDEAVSGRGGTASAEPGDFLIISARKRHLSRYAARLHELGVPCEVTGGAVLNEIRELALLCLCLEAIAEPDNPVSLVAVLRSELFGLRDDVLYAFRRAGGRFTFHSPMPEALDPAMAASVRETFERLQRYDSWLRRLPPVAAIEQIAADLGLAARAAVLPGGNVRAGSIARAIELIRSAQTRLFSVGEVVAYLRQLVDGDETHDGLPAATTPRSPVRIMNLHQAKGLEAPYVFLADPTGASDHSPTLHIDRGSDRVRGYMCISATTGEYTSQMLAYPAGWETHAATEQQFQAAERNRLLYVAATRAGSRLIVSQRVKGNTWNPWEPLDQHLTDCPCLKLPEPAEHSPPSERTVPVEAAASAAAEISRRWNRACQPSYSVAAVKAISVTPSKRLPSVGEHGTEWGSVIHLLLENAMRDPTQDLQRLAIASLADQGLDRSYATDAIATVEAVMRSEIWKRVQQSERRFVEIPYQTLKPADPNIDGSVPVILRGVIDLIFRDRGGWIVVDYKTDKRPEDQLPDLIARYRGQLAAYADFWQATVGEPVVERGLYFTHTNRYERV